MDGAPTKCSYKQVVIWGSQNKEDAQAKGIIDQEILNEEEIKWSDDEVELIGGEVPFIGIGLDRKKELRMPWRFAVIAKVLGRTFNYNTLHQRLFTMWCLDDEASMVDLGFGYYVIKMPDNKTLVRVLSCGLWKVMDHYVLF